MPYSGSNNNYSTEVSLSDVLFSFMLKNVSSAMYVDWDPPHLSPIVCYPSSMQELMLQGMQKVQKSCYFHAFDVERTLRWFGCGP